MSYQEVNDLKSFISVLVLGQCQTYVNILKEQLLSVVHTELETLTVNGITFISELSNELKNEVKQEVQSQGKEVQDTLQVILRELVQDFDEEDLTG